MNRSRYDPAALLDQQLDIYSIAWEIVCVKDAVYLIAKFIDSQIKKPTLARVGFE
jgi:hypothetical protein